MENNKKTISANEINKYMYCPYQWYYERYYGKKHIREMHKKRMEHLKIKRSTESRFLKGQKFHNEYFKKDKLKRRLRLIFFIMVVIFIIYVYSYFIFSF